MSAVDSSEPDMAETTARYLADQLSAADAAAFEARVAAQPQLYRDIDVALRLKEGLATLQERGELAPLLARDRRRVFAAAAIAAAIALVVGALWLGRTAPHAEAVILASAEAALLDASGKQLPVAARVTLVRTRGGVQANEVTLPAARAALELALVPPSIDGRVRYRVSLNRTESGGSVAKVGEIRDVTVDASGYVHLFIDAATMTPGIYAIALQAEGDEDRAPRGEVGFVVLPARMSGGA